MPASAGMTGRMELAFFCSHAIKKPGHFYYAIDYSKIFDYKVDAW